MNDSQIKINPRLESLLDELTNRGKTILLFAVQGILEIVIRLDNKTNLRPEARSVIRHL